MSTDDPRRILVVSVTSKQGRALLHAGLVPEADDYLHFVALTCNARSHGALQLKALCERVFVVDAGLNKPETVRKVFKDAKLDGGFYRMFVVLAFPGLGEDTSGEEAQGKLHANVLPEFGIKHFVYSSAECGDESRDDDITLSRLAKARVKRHIMSLENLR